MLYKMTEDAHLMHQCQASSTRMPTEADENVYGTERCHENVQQEAEDKEVE